MKYILKITSPKGTTITWTMPSLEEAQRIASDMPEQVLKSYEIIDSDTGEVVIKVN